VTIANGSYSFNQECERYETIVSCPSSVSTDYALAQNQRAILPAASFGAEGNLVSSSVGGNLSWALRANAYVTPGVGKGRGQISSFDRNQSLGSHAAIRPL
jgi:hypothetical protein